MNNNFDEQVNRVLNSTDGMTPVEAPPYFYSKLRTRMEKDNETIIFFRRPAFAIAAFSFFVLMNIVMIVKSNQQNISSTNSSTLDGFVSTYGLDNSWGN